MKDSYDRWRKVVKDNIGEINTIADIKRAMEYVDNRDYSDSSKNIYKALIKKLWWENHQKNKKNKSDLEWEMDKYKYDRTKTYKKQHLTDKNIAEIYIACRSVRQELFVLFLAETGCRISELTNMRLSNCRVCGDGVDLSFEASKTGITVYQRISFELFTKIIKVFNSKIYLFETSGKKPYRNEYISMQIKKIGKIINLDISANSLRHYYITTRINNKDNLLDISKSVGHKNPGSILTFYHTGE